MAFPKRYETSTTLSPRELKAIRAVEIEEEEEEDAAERPKRTGSDKMLIAMLISASFFMSYGYALSVRDQRIAANPGAFSKALPAAPTNLDPNAKLDKSKKLQTVEISSSGSFNPQTVFAKPDVPLKIKFGQGAGCTAAVQFPQFNIYKDLTQGPAEVDLPALKPGQYQFACGMNMLYGLVVVK